MQVGRRSVRRRLHHRVRVHHDGLVGPQAEARLCPTGRRARRRRQRRRRRRR